MKLRYILMVAIIFSSANLSAAKKLDDLIGSKNKSSIDLEETFGKDKKTSVRQITIAGAFGFALGAKFNPAAVGARPGKNAFSYFINPAKKFRNWNNYMVDITPITGKIYQISAVYFFKDELEMNREKEIVLALLREKYSESIGEGRVAAEEYFYYRNENTGRFVVLTVQRQDEFKGLMLMYTDKKLADLAQQEQLKIEKTQSNSELL